MALLHGAVLAACVQLLAAIRIGSPQDPAKAAPPLEGDIELPGEDEWPSPDKVWRHAERPPRPGCSVSKPWESGWPAKLDTGIYWYGHDDHHEKATAGASKFYKPGRKTLIYIHGWMGNAGGATTWCYRATTKCNTDVCGDERVLADEWLKGGWNVGIFYWDQLSDEKCIGQAEAKIWKDLLDNTSAAGPANQTAVGEANNSENCLSWVSSSNGIRSENALCSEPSVAHMCAHAIGRAMDDFTGPQMHLAGHSLGSGLTVRCASLLHEMGYAARPTRVSVLDPDFPPRKSLVGLEPFQDNNGRVYIGKSCPIMDGFRPGRAGLSEDALEQSADLVRDLRMRGVPTVLTLTSALPLKRPASVPIWPLIRESIIIKYDLTVCKARYSGIIRKAECEHNAAHPLFFLSNGAALPNATEASVAEIMEYMSQQQKHIEDGMQPIWQQVSGGDTFAGADDTFEFKLDSIH